MKYYTQLSSDERVRIAFMKQQGFTIRAMARDLNRSPSTLSRELRRNEAPPGNYWPDTATKLAKSRKQKQSRIDASRALQMFIKDQLSCHFWTPEQIAGHLKHRQDELPYVSHETIYKWLYAPSQKGEKLFKYLTRRQSKRGYRSGKNAFQGRIKDRVSIHERPVEINENNTFGHWEADLMSCLKNTQFMLVLRERTTMFIRSIRLPNKTAHETNQAIIQLMQDLPSGARKSITYDNGTEFAFHGKIKEILGVETYFCDPRSPWQKGRVENSNGRLRRDFPRKINLKQLSQDDFTESIENYNLIPRKSLDWDTPYHLFQENLIGVALQT